MVFLWFSYGFPMVYQRETAGMALQIDRRIAERISGSLSFLDGESYTGRGRAVRARG